MRGVIYHFVLHVHILVLCQQVLRFDFVWVRRSWHTIILIFAKELRFLWLIHITWYVSFNFELSIVPGFLPFWLQKFFDALSKFSNLFVVSTHFRENVIRLTIDCYRLTILFGPFHQQFTVVWLWFNRFYLATTGLRWTFILIHVILMTNFILVIQHLVLSVKIKSTAGIVTLVRLLVVVPSLVVVPVAAGWEDFAANFAWEKFLTPMHPHVLEQISFLIELSVTGLAGLLVNPVTVVFRVRVSRNAAHTKHFLKFSDFLLYRLFLFHFIFHYFNFYFFII